MLIDYFEKLGYLTHVKTINDTYFGLKPETLTSPVEFDLAEILNLYRKLTFGEGKIQSRWFGYLSEQLKRTMPRSHFALKKLRGKAKN